MNNSMKRVQQGFTLIELMIVVAIIGILAAVAIPQYRDYTSKAKIGSAVTVADALKTAVSLCVQENGGDVTVCDAGANGIASNASFTATKEVSAVSVTDGVITLTLNAPVAGAATDKLCFAPTAGTGAVVWNAGVTLATTNAAITTAVTKNNVGTAPTCA